MFFIYVYLKLYCFLFWNLLRILIAWVKSNCINGRVFTYHFENWVVRFSYLKDEACIWRLFFITNIEQLMLLIFKGTAFSLWGNWHFNITLIYQIPFWFFVWILRFHQIQLELIWSIPLQRSFVFRCDFIWWKWDTRYFI